MKKIEGERNNVMNGKKDMEYYINFSFHYKLFTLFELLIKKSVVTSLTICATVLDFDD